MGSVKLTSKPSRSVVGALTLLVAQAAAAAGPGMPHAVPWKKTAGLERPESVLYVREGDAIFVANPADGLASRKGGGWITRMMTSGTVVSPQWASGLSGPKGMAATPGRLWVVTTGELVALDLATGREVAKVAVPEAKYLNDVAADDAGNLYVSDTGAGAVYKIEQGRVTTFVAAGELSGPNGLAVRDHALIVVDRAGKIQAIDLKTRARRLVAQLKSPLDGVVVSRDGALIVSDAEGGRIVRVLANGTAQVVATGLQGPADIGLIPQGRLLLVPEATVDRVTALDMATEYLPGG